MTPKTVDQVLSKIQSLEEKLVALKSSVHRQPTRDKSQYKAWQKLRGIWKGRKGPDPARWQKKIRKEWERSLP